MENKDIETGNVFNFNKLLIGLVLLIGSTAIFLAKFDTFHAGHTFKQSIGIFFCVGFFTMGTMMVFSAISFGNKMIYLVAPFVVILGTFFVMNFFNITGIRQLLTNYPTLQASKEQALTKLSNAEKVIIQLQKENRNLQSRYFIEKAKKDFYSGEKLDIVVNSLKLAAKEMQKTDNKLMQKRVKKLLDEIQKISYNINSDFIELEKNLK